MASPSSVERLTEVFSLALEDRAPGYADLVSNSNVILKVMKAKGGWKPYSGPAIRERLLYNESGTFTRYQGHEFLSPKPADLIVDAEYRAKQAAVSVSLSMQEILDNSGEAQILDVMETHMEAAETELTDRFVEDLHGDGTADGGRAIGGLQAAVPTVNTTGVYGGLDRATAANSSGQFIWRTGSYTATGLVGGVLSSTNTHDAFSQVLINHTRGRNGPNVIACDATIFRKFQSQLMAIQRVTKEGGSATLGFPSLAYAGVGYELDVVLEGGIGSAMPSGTAYFLRLGKDGLCYRYHPQRNFAPLAPAQRPINQDSVVRHIGYYGNLTMSSPLFCAKLRDT